MDRSDNESGPKEWYKDPRFYFALITLGFLLYIEYKWLNTTNI